jgi:hypothetical protein
VLCRFSNICHQEHWNLNLALRVEPCEFDFVLFTMCIMHFIIESPCFQHFVSEYFPFSCLIRQVSPTVEHAIPLVAI